MKFHDTTERRPTQPDGDLRGGAEPVHADGAQRLHREPGHLGPDALPHHHAAHPRRDPLPDVAGEQLLAKTLSRILCCLLYRALELVISVSKQA